MTIIDEQINIFKALSDTNRLMIVDMLSCGELCACKLLERFPITQPTLSHHMKVLMDCGLVLGSKEGVWMYYSLNQSQIDNFVSFIHSVTSHKEQCDCGNKEDCCKHDYN